MNITLKFAIIGTGSISEIHAAAIHALPNANLTAICSSSPQRAKLAEEKYGVAAYTNYNLMMDEEKPDVVCICTKSGDHLEPTLAAAARGIHVLSEKPLEINLERAEKMINACKAAKVKLGCVFQNRFSNHFKIVKKAVDEGKLGKLLMGNAYIKWFRESNYYQNSNWRGTLQGDGGAALINQGIHTIDLLLNLFGEVKTVFGEVRTMTHAIEGEDVGAAMLSFENGAMGTIQGSTAFYPGYPEKLEIFGEKGSIMLEGGKISTWNVQGCPNPLAENSEPTKSGAADPMNISNELHIAQFQDFISAIQNNKEPLVNGEEGTKALKLILAIYESSKSKKLVSINQ